MEDDRFFSDGDEEDVKLESGYVDRDRVGNSRNMDIQGDLFVGKKYSKSESPESRFATAVDAICRSLQSRKWYSITDGEINQIIEKSHVFSENIKYYNPTAFILGYIASAGGTSEKKENFDTALGLLRHIGVDNAIEPPDVVRYMRLWRRIS